MSATASIPARRRAVAVLLAAVVVGGAGGLPPASAAVRAAPTAEPVGTADEAWVGGLVSTSNDGCGFDPDFSHEDQFGEAVVGDRSTRLLSMRTTCLPYEIRVTSFVSDAEPADGFPYVLRVTNLVTARRQGSAFPCGLSITRHEVAWPDGEVPRAQYRDVELLTTFPEVSLCGAAADAMVHLRVHAASEGGGDHVPRQVRVGNRRV